MKYYTEEHEWVEVKDGVAYVGISQHAADELGDITYIELPQEGEFYGSGDTLGVVESVKAASDFYAPISGKVLAINTDLEDNPELLNESAEDEAWICQLDLENANDVKDLMDEDAYAEFLGD
ncbi:MAG: glycine cleavage system protein GcvH [Victivallales bacterium]|nr:glycine cleavage system protein GcvH [Victivallales bacterium]